MFYWSIGFINGSAGKESTCNVGNTGDVGLIPGLGRSPGGGNGNPLQCSCPKNLMGREACRATVQRVAKSQAWLSDWAHTTVDLPYCVSFWWTAVIPLYIHAYILFHIIFSYDLLQDLEYNSLWYTVELCCIPILYVIVCIC